MKHNEQLGRAHHRITRFTEAENTLIRSELTVQEQLHQNQHRALITHRDSLFSLLLVGQQVRHSPSCLRETNWILTGKKFPTKPIRWFESLSTSDADPNTILDLADVWSDIGSGLTELKGNVGAWWTVSYYDLWALSVQWYHLLTYQNKTWKCSSWNSSLENDLRIKTTKSVLVIMRSQPLTPHAGTGLHLFTGSFLD